MKNPIASLNGLHTHKENYFDLQRILLMIDRSFWIERSSLVLYSKAQKLLGMSTSSYRSPDYEYKYQMTKTLPKYSDYEKNLVQVSI